MIASPIQAPQRASGSEIKTPVSKAGRLLREQMRFAEMVPRLIKHAIAEGYQVTLGDAYRDPRVFGSLGERKGYGESNSAHKRRLAIDLNLFWDGRFLDKTEDHESLGAFWESIGGTWGGRFNDGNHYSLEFDGYK